MQVFYHRWMPCGDETSMRLEGPQSLVNIAHIGKVKFCVWNVKPTQHVASARMTVVVAQNHPLECQMSKGVSDEQTQTGNGVKARPQHENSRPTGQSGYY
jgi:hypothetical protein